MAAAALSRASAAQALMLPEGYFLDAKGIISIPVTYELNGEEKQKLEPLFLGQITVPWRQKTAKTGTLNFRYRVGRHMHHIAVHDGEMALENVLVQCLARQGCHANGRQQKHLVNFMKAWTTLIDELTQRNTAAPFGWVYDDGVYKGFAYGGVMFKPDGTEGFAGQPDPNLNDTYTPEGTIDPMMKALDILHGENHAGLEITTLQCWAAPLVHLYGVDTCVTWCWSQGGGAHKSTAAKIGQALWGSPRRAKENPDASKPGLQQKLGQLRNLPVVIDEIQKADEIDKVNTIIHYLTEATSGAKSTRNRKVAEVKEWQTLVNCCANGRSHDRMMKVSASTDADVMRVLEIHIEKRPNTGKDHAVTSLIDELNNNYGQLGMKYARQLAMNRDAFKARCMVIADEVGAALVPRQEERFWVAAIVCTLLACELANVVIGKNIFRRDPIRDHLFSEFKKNRAFVESAVVLGGSSNEAEDIMTGFQREYMNNQLWTDTYNVGKGRAKVLKIIRMPPMNVGKGHPVIIHWAVNDRLLRVSRAQLADYIANKLELPPTSSIHSILKHFGGVASPNKRSLTSGAYHERVNPSSPETLLEFPVPAGSYFEPGLLAATSQPPVVDPLTAAVTTASAAV